MKIIPLVNFPEAIPTLTKLFVKTWGPYYGPAGPGDADTDLRGCLNRDSLPLALVAIDDHGQVLGTAALKTESVETHRHLSPWLAAVVVRMAARRNGVATALVAAIEHEAHRLGHDALYTGTLCLSGLMRRRGWEGVDEAPSLRGAMTVYRLDLRAD
jgi:GNAT superfamily N-acetyltransferase